MDMFTLPGNELTQQCFSCIVAQQCAINIGSEQKEVVLLRYS